MEEKEARLRATKSTKEKVADLGNPAHRAVGRGGERGEILSKPALRSVKHNEEKVRACTRLGRGTDYF